MVPEVDPAAFAAAHADGAFVIDVREPYEYVSGHVPRAVLIPMAQVHARMNELPRDARVHVICQTGNRSLAAADWLRTAGFDAVSVAAGTSGWIRLGKPLVRGRHADESVA